jgi:hypothetical protein
MQLSTRGPSGPGHRARLSRGKTIRDAVASACQRDAPARFADRHRNNPSPAIVLDPVPRLWREGHRGPPAPCWGATSPPGRPVGPDVCCRLSQRAARLRGRRDDPIALPSTLGCCPDRRQGYVSCGARTRSRRRRLDRYACSSSRTGVRRRWARHSSVVRSRRARTGTRAPASWRERAPEERRGVLGGSGG